MQMTVGEALWFSARLRFTSEVDNGTVEAFIAEVRDHLSSQLCWSALWLMPGEHHCTFVLGLRGAISAEY